MIQRIQSLFLLLVTVLMVIVLFSPIGIFVGNFGYCLYKVSNLHSVMLVKFPLLIPEILTVIVALGSLVTVFLFKKRKVQVTLSIIGIILLALLYVSVIAYFLTADKQLGSVFHASFIMSLPGISMGLLLLSIIFIKKDEKLVKSTDRIR
jgi:hypothetical protein